MNAPRWMAAVLILVGFIVGVAVQATVDAIDRPSCPTEDSCTIDYGDGAWHIEEVNP